MCHLIFLCFMTTAVFPLEYLDSMSCSCTSSHTKRLVYSHFLANEDVSEYSLTLSFQLLRLLRRSEGTINTMFTLKALLGRVIVQLLIY